MNLRFPFSLALFAGSYLPLSIILLVRDIDLSAPNKCFQLRYIEVCFWPLRNPGLGLSILAGCALSLFVSIVILYLVRRKVPIQVASSKYVPSEMISYTIPYVAAFWGASYNDTDDILALGIFLLWMFILLYKSGVLLMNPVLVVFGWRLHEITYKYSGDGAESFHNSFVLARESFISPGQYRHGYIGSVLLIDKPGVD